MRRALALILAVMATQAPRLGPEACAWALVALGLAIWALRPQGWGLVLAVIFARAPYWGAPPIYSDDVYRYLWEGRLWLHGFNPYAYAPDHPELSAIRDATHALVNHPSIPSVYPPLAQALFVLLAPHLVLWQLAASLADVGTAMLLERRRPGAGWLWALLPLPALESASSGHLESFGVFALMLGLRHPFFLWVAGMIKLWPLAIFAPSRIRALLLTLVLLAPLAFAPGLHTYAAHWSFNSLSFQLASDFLYPRPLLSLLFALIVLGTWRLPLQQRALIVASAFVSLSPTAHPWYALWALAMGLALGSTPWILLGVVMPLAYRVLATVSDGVWHEDPKTAWLIWLPVWITLVLRIGAKDGSSRFALPLARLRWALFGGRGAGPGDGVESDGPRPDRP